MADFLHPQNTEYTYFCHKNSHYTWIDHILTTSHNVNTIEMCDIIPELDGNVSDHQPLRMLFTPDVSISMKAAKIQQEEALARPLWGDTERKNKYRDILQRKL